MPQPIQSFYLHLSRHFLSIIMFFLSLVITSVVHKKLAFAGKEIKARSKSWSLNMYKWQNNMDALSSASIKGWMLRLYPQINSLSLKVVEKIAGSLLQAADRSSNWIWPKKKEVSQLAWKIMGIKAKGACSSQGCYQSAQVSLKMFQTCRQSQVHLNISRFSSQ